MFTEKMRHRHAIGTAADGDGGTPPDDGMGDGAADPPDDGTAPADDGSADPPPADDPPGRDPLLGRARDFSLPGAVDRYLEALLGKGTASSGSTSCARPASTR